MVDPRFANPPEELELPSEPATSNSKKGKGRLMDDSLTLKTKTKTNKRKQPTQPESDSEGGDLYDEVLNGPLPSTSQAIQSKNGGEDNEVGEQEHDEDDNNGPLNLLPKVLQVDNVAEFNKRVDQTGIIYLSRIPPGMGPSKVKHILSNYGETGRIYLVAADTSNTKKQSHNSSKPEKSHKHKHQAHRFVEGWIEFMDKRVARNTAELLNAKTIGDVALSKSSKKNGGTKKWKDDVWTMKYLPRFKWNMLSEQVAIEAATRAALLRNELAQSKKEQAEYLRQVDRAKNHEKAQDKKRARQERKPATTDSKNADNGEEGRASKKPKKEREFEQRSVVSQNKGNGVVDAKLGSVLDSLF